MCILTGQRESYPALASSPTDADLIHEGPKGPTSTYHHTGVGVSMHEFEGDINVQFPALRIAVKPPEAERGKGGFSPAGSRGIMAP